MKIEFQVLQSVQMFLLPPYTSLGKTTKKYPKAKRTKALLADQSVQLEKVLTPDSVTSSVKSSETILIMMITTTNAKVLKK